MMQISARFALSWDACTLPTPPRGAEPTLRSTPQGLRAELPGQGAHLFATTSMAHAPGETLHLVGGQAPLLPQALHLLEHSLGVRHLLVEGEPALLRALLELGSVEVLDLTLCPQLQGGTETLTGPAGGAYLPAGLPYTLEAMEPLPDGTCHLRYRKSVNP